jgi:hypothetical protein
LAKATGIPLTHALAGPNVGSNGAMITSLQSASNKEAAIGFVSTETADAARDSVRALAFQAAGQKWAYWPDSDAATARDKINVREGRYDIWNHHYFYARLDDKGDIVDADTARWIGYLTEDQPLPDGLQIVDVEIASGNIPDCAMKVKRDGDLGPLSSYQPDISCGCYFETHAPGASGTPPSSCQACDNQAGAEKAGEAKDPSCPAATPYCRYGFCEVK